MIQYSNRVLEYLHEHIDQFSLALSKVSLPNSISDYSKWLLESGDGRVGDVDILGEGGGMLEC